MFVGVCLPSRELLRLGSFYKNMVCGIIRNFRCYGSFFVWAGCFAAIIVMQLGITIVEEIFDGWLGFCAEYERLLMEARLFILMFSVAKRF